MNLPVIRLRFTVLIGETGWVFLGVQWINKASSVFVARNPNALWALCWPAVPPSTCLTSLSYRFLRWKRSKALASLRRSC